MNSPVAYKNIFLAILNNQAQIAPWSIGTLYFGESRRAIEGNKSTTEYPALLLEIPDFQWKEMGDNMTEDTSCAFSVVIGCPVDDYDAQDSALDTTLQICKAIIKVLRDNDYIKIGDTINAEPMTASMSDNAYGYRISFTIKKQEADFLC
jgi:hypothetical protein